MFRNKIALNFSLTLDFRQIQLLYYDFMGHLPVLTIVNPKGNNPYTLGGCANYALTF